MSTLLVGPTRSHMRRVGFLVSRLATTTVVIAAMVVGLLPPVSVHADGNSISGGSNTTGEAESYIPITGISVSGAPSDVVPVTVSVDRGQLSMTTTTGLTFTGNPTGNNISFEGTVTNVNAALATLRYISYSVGTVTLTAQLTGAGEVYFPGNSHVYEVVYAPHITADDALTAAAGRTKYGATGYLATITTQEENDYVGPRLGGDGWFGARDSNVEGTWEWATGPEAGTVFFMQDPDDGGGTPVDGMYSNWNEGEPNQSGNEDCSQFYSNGSGWNDLPCTAQLDYYIVEYGDDEVTPSISNTSFTVTTTTPTADNVTIGSCLDLLGVSTSQNEHRHDHLKLTSNIDCQGETISPLFNDNDPDFGDLDFRGTFNGQGHTISNFVIDQEDGSYVGLFAKANGATITNLTLSDVTVTGEDCVGGLAGESHDTTIQNVTSNASVAGEYYVGGLVGCYYGSDDDVSLEDNTVSGSVDGYEYVGGLVGYSEIDNGHAFTFEDNTWSGSIASDNADWAYGGLAGEIDLENESSLSLKHNTSAGVNSIADTEDAYGVGGLVGELGADDGSTATIEANTLTGDVEGAGYMGGLIGELYIYDESQVVITNSTQPRDVIGTDYYVGGLVGELYLEGDEDTKLTITNAVVGGDVTGSYEVGGLIGEGYGDEGDEQVIITNVHTTGGVTGNNNYVGGFAGYLTQANIQNSYATGTITGAGDVGGLAGELEYSTVTNSYATGDIVNGSDSGGGLVGESYGINILRSFATGDVTGFGAVGGLVGYYNDSTITDSYARGSVDGNNASGGLVGGCNGSVASSYATGAVTSDGEDIGGLIGYDSGCDVSSSFWDTQTSGLEDSNGGTGKTTTQMKTAATFTDTDDSDGLDEAWDFEDTWSIESNINDGYPCLLWYGNCADDDSDGTPTAIEDAAPNDGDANNDSTPDSQQPNIASFVNSMTGKYTSIALPNDCSLTAASVQTENSQTTQDAGYQYQSGLVHFAADCGTPGYTATVKVYMYGVQKSGLALRKYNPNTHTYFTVSSAVLTQETIGGQTVTVATYSVTDGGELDTDGTANGVIVDPVGLATSIVGAPNTGLGSQGIFAGRPLL